MNKRKLLFIFSLLIGIVAYLLFDYQQYKSIDITSENEVEKNEVVEENDTLKEEIKEPELVSLTLSAVGDCTVGSDPAFGYSRSFHEMFDKNSGDYSYFFKGVQSILGNDDITIANLETTFTEATDRAIKTYNFKGPASYANILKYGSVEIVNIANNHTYDYKEAGYIDTMNALNEVNVPFFGNENVYIYEIKNLKIGFVGYYSNFTNVYPQLEKDINYLKEQNVNLIIASFHWGVEKNYQQNNTQRQLGQYAIDLGADLVIGHHPHVIQGIEMYNNKYIVYSLANFVFGGNRNPKDKDSFIFQQQFNFVDGILDSSSIEIVPISVSSKVNANDYQPQVLTGEEKTRVLEKVLKYSNISY